MPKLATLLCVPALLAAHAAKAGPLLSGSFSSTAVSGSFLTPAGSVNVAGSTVTGAFALASVAGATTPAGLPAGDYLLQPGAVTLSFNVQAIGQTFNYPNSGSSEDSTVELTDTGSVQTLLLGPEFVDPHDTNFVELTGPEGSLFANIDDPGSIHLGQGVSLVSPIFLGVYGEGSATLDVTSAHLGPAAVPEPGGWALLGLPAIGVALCRRTAAWRSGRAGKSSDRRGW